VTVKIKVFLLRYCTQSYFTVNFFTTPRNLEASFVMDERKWKPHFKLQGYVTTALTR